MLAWIGGKCRLGVPSTCSRSKGIFRQCFREIRLRSVPPGETYRKLAVDFSVDRRGYTAKDAISNEKRITRSIHRVRRFLSNYNDDLNSWKAAALHQYHRHSQRKLLALKDIRFGMREIVGHGPWKVAFPEIAKEKYQDMLFEQLRWIKVEDDIKIDNLLLKCLYNAYPKQMTSQILFETAFSDPDAFVPIKGEEDGMALRILDGKRQVRMSARRLRAMGLIELRKQSSRNSNMFKKQNVQVDSEKIYEHFSQYEIISLSDDEEESETDEKNESVLTFVYSHAPNWEIGKILNSVWWRNKRHQKYLSEGRYLAPRKQAFLENYGFYMSR